MIRRLWRGRPVLAATASTIALLSLTPAAYLIIRALGDGWTQAWQLLTRPRVLELTVNTLVLTGSVVAASLLLGIVLAWLTTMSDLPFRGVWAAVLAVPLAIPSYVTAFIWVAELPQTAGFFGAFAVLTLSCFPLVTLPVSAAMRTGDRSGSEQSRMLGRGPLHTAATIGSRRIAPAAAAGALLVALYTISDFGAVALMRFDVYTLGIYSAYRGSFDRTSAAILGLVLLVLAFAFTMGERAARRGATARVGAGVGREALPFALGRLRIPASLSVAAIAGLAVGFPVYGLLRWMTESLRLTIEWTDVLSAATTSVELSLTAALVVAVLAWPIALYAARSTSWLSRGTETMTYLAHGLPGITVGLAMVFFGIRFLPSLYQTTWLLILAYAVLFLPLSVGSTRAGLVAIPTSLDDSARLLGSGNILGDLRIRLPIAFPAIASGAALVFLTVAKELPATLMLRPRGEDTLATSLWSLTSVFKYGEAAPYALAIILISVVPSIALQQVLAGRSESKKR